MSKFNVENLRSWVKANPRTGLGAVVLLAAGIGCVFLTNRSHKAVGGPEREEKFDKASPMAVKTTPPNGKQLSAQAIRQIYEGIGTGTLLKDVEQKFGPPSQKADFREQVLVENPYGFGNRTPSVTTAQKLVVTWQLKPIDSEKVVTITVKFADASNLTYSDRWLYNGSKKIDGP